MIFNEHSAFKGTHAFLSASKYSWLNYTDEKLDEVFINAMAARRGTELHTFASEAIRLGQKLKGNNTTLAMFVNDAIGFRMLSEQILFYSVNVYGCADAISFNRGKLRIHDLKTGVTPTSMKQLQIYAALFCLEYGVRPSDISIELRIYQNDTVLIDEPDVDVIVPIMDKIISFDKRIDKLKMDVM